jgi:hypothetical protein
MSFNSFGLWLAVIEDVDGNTYYIDTDTIEIKDDGYTYSLLLFDYIEPNEGYMSSSLLLQGDCKLKRFKLSAVNNYKQSMAAGNGDTDINNFTEEWLYQDSSTVGGSLLKYVCEDNLVLRFWSPDWTADLG